MDRVFGRGETHGCELQPSLFHGPPVGLIGPGNPGRVPSYVGTVRDVSRTVERAYFSLSIPNVIVLHEACESLYSRFSRDRRGCQEAGTPGVTDHTVTEPDLEIHQSPP